MILIQQDVTGSAQNLPKDDDVMGHGRDGRLRLDHHTLEQDLGTYRNVRGYHGEGGLGNSTPNRCSPVCPTEVAH